MKTFIHVTSDSIYVESGEDLRSLTDVVDTYYSPVEIWDFSDYQPCHLTQCEMAILDCLIEVLK